MLEQLQVTSFQEDLSAYIQHQWVIEVAIAKETKFQCKLKSVVCCDDILYYKSSLQSWYASIQYKVRCMLWP